MIHIRIIDQVCGYLSDTMGVSSPHQIELYEMFRAHLKHREKTV